MNSIVIYASHFGNTMKVAEAIGVTFLMKGGPATIHGPRAYDAFCEFATAIEAGEAPA